MLRLQNTLLGVGLLVGELGGVGRGGGYFNAQTFDWCLYEDFFY